MRHSNCILDSVANLLVRHMIFVRNVQKTFLAEVKTFHQQTKITEQLKGTISDIEVRRLIVVQPLYWPIHKVNTHRGYSWRCSDEHNTGSSDGMQIDIIIFRSKPVCRFGPIAQVSAQ